MTARGTRVGTAGYMALAALTAAGALALAAPSAWAAPGGAGAKKPKAAKTDAARPGPVLSGTGIVQVVRAHAVVVRELDGRAVLVPVGARTAVFVNGVRARLGQVKPGFVVTFTGRGGGAARELRASGPSGASTGRGSTAAVQSATADAVVVTSPSGATATIAVGSKTRVFLNGKPASIADIRSGDLVVHVAGAGKGQRPARVLRLRRPG